MRIREIAGCELFLFPNQGEVVSDLGWRRRIGMIVSHSSQRIDEEQETSFDGKLREGYMGNASCFHVPIVPPTPASAKGFTNERCFQLLWELQVSRMRERWEGSPGPPRAYTCCQFSRTRLNGWLDRRTVSIGKYWSIRIVPRRPDLPLSRNGQVTQHGKRFLGYQSS